MYVMYVFHLLVIEPRSPHFVVELHCPLISV